MNIIKLTYKVKSLAGDFDTSVECDFLNDNKSFLEVTDLIKEDLDTYNTFMDDIVSPYVNDFINLYINEEGLSVAEININEWKLTGAYDQLSEANKLKYDNFYNLVSSNII